MEAVMPMLMILAETIGMALGSLFAAALLAFFAWRISNYIHHPRSGWIMLIITNGGVWFISLGHGEFIKMMAVFGVAAAGLLYLVAQDERSEPSSKDTEINRLTMPGGRP
jgi:predicted small integral membrane protein